MRKPYLDNIRWQIVLSVLPFHVFYVSNHLGIYGTIPGVPNLPFMDFLGIGLYNPWVMVLVCSIAGITARYALLAKSSVEFFKGRVSRLLIPGTLGCLVYQWIAGYLMAYVKNPASLQNLTLTERLVNYLKFAFLDSIPLWFSQILFICCCVLLLVRTLNIDKALQNMRCKLNIFQLLALFVPVWICANIFDLRIVSYSLTRYRLGTNLAAFFLGYYILSQDAILELLKKKAGLLSVIAIISTIITCFAFHSGRWGISTYDRSLPVVWYIWTVLLAVMGVSQTILNHETPVTRYLSKISYGLLIVHYPVLALLCIVIPPLKLPAVLTHAVIILLEYLLSFLLHELLRRIPVIRYCIFGYQSK